MLTYPILNSKIDSNLWIKCVSLNNYPPKYIIDTKYKSDKGQISLIKTYSYICSNISDIPIDIMAINRYIDDIDSMIVSSEKTEKELNHINNIRQNILSINKYIIGDRLYPQITYNEQTGRIYYHPLFNWKPNHVDNLLFKYRLIEWDSKDYIKFNFDINGAVPRAFFDYISRIENNKEVYKLSNTSREIYKQIHQYLYDKELKDEEVNNFKLYFLIILNNEKRISISIYLKDIKNITNNLLIY